MNKCQFDVLMGYLCEEPTDDIFCKKHSNLRCVCGKDAIRKCDAQPSGIVCGTLLCKSCEHLEVFSHGKSNWNKKNHPILNKVKCLLGMHYLHYQYPYHWQCENCEYLGPQ